MTEKGSQDKNQTPPEGEKSRQEFLPPLDFSSIVLPFYMQALLKLGFLEDPARSMPPENLELARRLIDILDLLKERTKGNLKPEEEKFLAACLQQLKTGYLEKTKNQPQ